MNAAVIIPVALFAAAMLGLMAALFGDTSTHEHKLYIGLGAVLVWAVVFVGGLAVWANAEGMSVTAAPDNASNIVATGAGGAVILTAFYALGLFIGHYRRSLRR